MADQTKIEWCDRTFNPWMGCTKVSDGCKFCYAETLMDKRYGKVKWGPQGTRVRTSAAMWKKPLRWNQEVWEECAECGWSGLHSETHDFCPRCEAETWEVLRPRRQRVFCASLADVLEDRDELVPWRNDLFTLVERTPNLDWLILTKRIEKARELLPVAWFDEWPSHVWMGTSVENQKAAEERIPYLLDVPARVRFLSVEPMLGKIDISAGLPGNVHGLAGSWSQWTFTGPIRKQIDWVICGGESGKGCRPMAVEWALGLRYQCGAAGVPFFMKQLGGNPNKRDQLSDFPAALQVREWPV